MTEAWVPNKAPVSVLGGQLQALKVVVMRLRLRPDGTRFKDDLTEVATI